MSWHWSPANSWSAQNLLKDHGPPAPEGWHETYPPLPVVIYDPARLDLDRILETGSRPGARVERA